MECIVCGSRDNLQFCPFALEYYCEECLMKSQDQAREEINKEFDRLRAAQQDQPQEEGEFPW